MHLNWNCIGVPICSLLLLLGCNHVATDTSQQTESAISDPSSESSESNTTEGIPPNQSEDDHKPEQVTTPSDDETEDIQNETTEGSDENKPEQLTDDGDNEQVETGENCTPSECLFNDIAPVFYVNGTSSTTGDGLSWATSFTRIQDGIDAAACQATACDKTINVWVASGTYFVYKNSTEDTVLLRERVSVYGGFSGKETTLEQRDMESHPTILDGRRNPIQSERVLHVVVGNEDSLIDGFTITGGHSNGEALMACGGGMFNFNVSPTIRNCTFIGNTSQGCGGAIYNHGGSPVIEHTVFEDNISSNGDGGAIYNKGSDPVITSTSFFSNSADNYGGAIANTDDAGPTISQSIFDNNTAVGGGAVSSGQSAVIIENATFSNNSAFFGGALYNVNNTEFFMTNCTLTDNYAEEEGGALLQYDGDNTGDTTVSNSIFWNDFPQEIRVHNTDSDNNPPSIRYSTIQGGFAGQGNIDVAPDFADDNLTLSPNSPCIDNADDAIAPATDFLGNARVEIGGAGIEGTITDMGAFEYTP